MIAAETTRELDVLIVGAGPSALGVATRLGELGARGAVLLDREPQPGGLPAQSDHAGFGLVTFKRLLTGCDFAERLTRRALRAGAVLQLKTTVLSIERDRSVLAVSPEGLARYRPRALVLATGCRETPRSTRLVSGSRPAGVFNSGTVQRLETFAHALPGRAVVVVGSDDIGLLAAQTLAQKGVRVVAVVEERPYALGYLALEWFFRMTARVPLLLNHRVLSIRGETRVQGIELAHENATSVLACDAVIFAGEFVPENTLAREANLPLDAATRSPIVDQDFQTEFNGIFACGNLLHAADSSDHAWEEGRRVGEAVYRYLDAPPASDAPRQPIVAGDGVASVVPQQLRPASGQAIRLAVRVKQPRRAVRLVAHNDDRVCGRGFAFTAKPHRSVYFDLTPPRDSSGAIRVTAQGWQIAPPTAP